MQPTQNIYDTLRQGLPKTPLQGKNILPLPEILTAIEFFDKTDQKALAYDLAAHIIKHNNNPLVLDWYADLCFDNHKYEECYAIREKNLSKLSSVQHYQKTAQAAFYAWKFEESEQLVRTGLQHTTSNEPNLQALLKIDLALAISYQGRYDEAFAILQSIDLQPLDDRVKQSVQFAKGWYLVRLGQFSTGLKLLNLNRPWGAYTYQYTKPKWDGSPIPDKTLLIVGEGGIGDEIISARFVKILRERNINCSMSTSHKDPSLLKALQRIKGIDDVFQLTHSEHMVRCPHYDYWVSCIELPSLLDITEGDIPSSAYLKVLPSSVKKWKLLTHTNKKFKVGVKWAASKNGRMNHMRDIPFRYFEDLARSFPDIEFYSLQRDEGIQEMIPRSKIIPFHDKLETLDDTLGCIENLDMVITCCSSMYTLSGGLGKKTFVVVPIVPYYIWANPNKQSVWYDSISIYRQSDHCNWDTPFNHIKKDLKVVLHTYLQSHRHKKSTPESSAS
jgi:hypothetical protein